MDPELVKLVRHVMQARRNYLSLLRAERPSLTPADATKVDTGVISPKLSVFAPVDPVSESDWVQQESGGKYTLDDVQRIIDQARSMSPSNVARAAAQGVTLGWGDELAGLAAGKGAENSYRVRSDIFQQAHPAVNAFLNMAGGVVPAAASAAIMPEATVGAGGALLRGILSGAGIGAASGAGAADADRVRGALMGGLVGGAVGGATTVPEIAARAFTGPSRGLSRLRYAANTGEGGLPEVRNEFNRLALAGRGDITTVGDLSDPLRMEYDFAANNSMAARDRIARQLAARAEDTGSRLSHDIVDLLGKTPYATARMKELKTLRSAEAGGPSGYPGLPDAPADMTALQAHMNTPAVSDAWHLLNVAETGVARKNPQLADILETMGVKGPGSAAFDDFAAKLKAANPNLSDEEVTSAWRALGNTGGPASGTLPELSMKDLHVLKQIAGDRADKGFKAGGSKSASGAAYRSLQNSLDDFLDKNWPGYGAVKQRYAENSEAMRALEAGAKAFNGSDPRDIAHEMAAMSPRAIAEYRTGLASSLLNSLQTPAGVRKLLKMSDAMQGRLQAAFPSEDMLRQFMDYVEAERTLIKGGGSMANSFTHLRDAMSGDEATDVQDIALTGALYGNSGMGGMAKRSLLKRLITRGSTRKTADATAANLLKKGKDADAFLSQLEAKPGTYTQASTHILPPLLAQQIANLMVRLGLPH